MVLNSTTQTFPYENSEFPVVVIGAGLGGLGAACRLALSGEKVLLLEKHNLPGGFATSFIRGRFEFEGALHVLASVGTEQNPGTLYTFFDDLKILNKVEFRRPKELFRAFCYDGFDFTFPLGLDEYFDKLVELYPQERNGIQKFKSIALKVWDGFMYVALNQGKASPLKLLLKHPYLVRMGGLTLEDVFDRCIKDQKLRLLIAQLWGYNGLPPSRLNAMYYILTLIGVLKDVVYPVGRSHALSSALIESFEAMGGEIKYNWLVNRILVREGKIHGVESLNGQKISCKAVISNVNPICTTHKMLPKESVPKQYLKRVYAPEVGVSAFTVYIGVNKSPNDVGLSEYEIFLNATDDIEQQYISMGHIQKPLHAVAACYNNIYEGVSPPGTCQICITTLQLGKNWTNLNKYQYHETKDKMTDNLVSMLEETIIPDIRNHIEVIESASPLTYYRYSKSIDGAIYGYVQDVFNSPMLRLNSRGAVRGLYLAGAWVNLGGGFSTSLTSGIMAAGMYLEDKEKGEV